VAGDSAGGGLAAHVAQRLRDDGPGPAALQVLFYPATDFSLAHTDRDPALAQLLSWDTIDWFATHSMPPAIDRRDPGISPLYAEDLTGLPPALVITAGVDPFRSDAIAYCAALRSTGVAAVHRDFPGQIHGFAGMDLVFPAGREALRQAATAVAEVVPVLDPVVALAAVPPIRQVRGIAHRRRRLRDAAQRFPHVNGTYMLATLLEYRIRSAARALSAARPEGGPR
jgi:acetyl esterase